MTNPDRKMGESLAIVSGKGGSGKTLVATTLALGLAKLGKRVLLIDADLGTGGLTYYLGFSLFENTREGLVEFLNNPAAPVEKFFAKPAAGALSIEMAKNLRLLPIGDHRVLTAFPGKFGDSNFGALLDNVCAKFDFVIVDCRGGLDEESLHVCKLVDKILIVVETDAAAIRASQYLSDVLRQSGLVRRVSGFVLNKVMDDPTALASAGRTFFGTDFLGGIPFDLETTRDFVRGKTPRYLSLFSKHVLKTVNKIFPEVEDYKGIVTFRDREFSQISLRDPGVRAGGVIVWAIVAYVCIAYYLAYFSGVDVLGMLDNRTYVVFVPIVVLLLVTMSLSESAKKIIGEPLLLYARLITRVTRNRSRD